MNFIAETNRFARLLETWKDGHGFSDREALQDIAKIWDEFKNIPERKKVIYQGALGDLPKTDVSCSNCIFDMLTMVYNWRKILEHEVTYYVRDVSVATVETVKMSFDVPQTFPSKVENVPIDYTVKETPLESMRMHQIRSIARKKGITYTNKTTKEELIQLLSEKR